MNGIIRLLTASFIISALLIGIGGYVGTKQHRIQFSHTVDNFEESCFGAMQHIAAYAGTASRAAAEDPFCGLIAFPLPVACISENMKPF